MSNYISDHSYQTSFSSIGGGLGGVFGTLAYVRNEGVHNADCCSAIMYGIGYSIIGSFIGNSVGKIVDGIISLPGSISNIPDEM